MVKKKKEQELKYITQEGIEEKIKNHLLVLRGEINLDNNLSGYYFGSWTENFDSDDEKEHEINYQIFEDRNLQGIIFEKSKFSSGYGYKTKSFGEKEKTYFKISFKNSNLKEVNFKNADLSNGVIFTGANLKGADFRGAKFNTDIFSKEQEKEVILTDEDYKKYLEKKKLEEENKKLKNEVKIKNKTIKNTSEKQINKLTESFEKLEHNFGVEEKRWLGISFIIFVCLLFFLSIPIFDIFMYTYTYKIIFWGIIVIIGLIVSIITMIASIDMPEEEKSEGFIKEIWNLFKKGWGIFLYLLLVFSGLNSFINGLSNPTESVFHLNTKYALLPLGILLSTFLYFSIYQYSKAKKLRIENSNKIALLHGYIAIKTEKNDGMDKGRFYDKIADVVFSKVYQGKESNLPIDKIIDIVKLIDKK